MREETFDLLIINEKLKIPLCRNSSKIKIKNRRKMQNGYSYIYDHSLAWLSTDTSIKVAELI
jgi:hypothetical protein